jgi:DNA primase
VAFDPDAAGQSAAARTHALFASHGIAPLAAITFPPGTDPADRLARRGPPVLLGALETSTRPLADLVIDARLARFARSLEFTDGKFKALDAVAPLIARLPAGQVARQVARVSEHIGLTCGDVTDAVTDAVHQLVRSRERPSLLAAKDRARELPGMGGNLADPPAARRQALTDRCGRSR